LLRALTRCNPIVQETLLLFQRPNISVYRNVLIWQIELNSKFGEQPTFSAVMWRFDAQNA
ncbi:hypothetical protein, partial [Paenibacillus sp. Soil787]|uniref:hypothetical protein n=1 Tax=Paenibacillus sp. Soil787 TaxID=1736411 RepID=UPI001F477B2E